MIYVQSANGLIPVSTPQLKTINGQSLLGQGDLFLNINNNGALSQEFGKALLDCFTHVAWTDDQGAQYYNALYQALYPVDEIKAVFSQENFTIFDDTDLNSLKSRLVVTAYSNGSGTQIADADYTLSGILTPGVSTITVTYFGFTSTFEVNVTAINMPDAYTKYDYIQRKASTKGSTIAQTNFIWLPALENINTLSFEGIFGQKPNTTNATIGLWGARPESGLGYSFYWNGTESDPAYVYARGKTTSIPSIRSMDKIKLTINNPETSPYTVSINDEQIASTNWTADGDVNITTPISLFNNIPAGNTSNMYINFTARIGNMLFRNAQGECVAYFIPCIDDSQRIGMYDVIGQQFYTAETASAVTVDNSNVLYQVGNWE